VTTENGKPTLYVQLQKALCGTLSASLLFWKDLSQHLKERGFAPNPHDNCVMNKMVKGKQSTILWHVDDLKISHVDGRVNEDMIEKLNDRCGKETPVTVEEKRAMSQFCRNSCSLQSPCHEVLILKNQVIKIFMSS
jgi:hypothetical protein